MQTLSAHFKIEERIVLIRWMKIVLFYMAVPLVISFSVVDYFFHPELLTRFLLARLLVLPVTFVSYNLYRFKFVRETFYELPAHVFTVFISLLNTYMAYQTGGEMSPYYAGLNLVGIGAAFLPWTIRQMLVCCSLLYLPYFAMVFLFHPIIEISYFIPNSAFIMSTIFLAVIINRSFTSLRMAQLDSRLKIEEQVRAQEETIRRKTNEGIYLEKLTSQFSPQIVEAIKSNAITVDRPIRREITGIFIDVQSSTNRSLKIDQTDYVNVLQDFFTECVEIFLKHDVTVGTYLGDGLFGFVNAPKNIDNHAVVAIEACNEILKMHCKKKCLYKEKWRSEFNVRLGVNTGIASLGFYPSVKRGTYSAVGEGVNLAARLCGIAKPNSICVPKSFVRNLAGKISNINISFQGTTTTLKGFEDEEFDLFSITPIDILNISAEGSCPVCSAGLEHYASHGDSLFVKCESCGYVDVAADNSQLKIAA